MTPLELVTVAAIALLAWVYAGYPLAASAAARLRPVRLRDDGAAPRLVTIGLAVHDEAPRLEERVANALAQEAPFDLEVVIASDGSTDDTVAIGRSLAATDVRVRILDLGRVGQTAAQNEIFAVARGDVVVLTDAETAFAPDCLARLVAPFRDRRVGCTTGRLTWREPGSTATGRDEGAYWRYEQWVRRVESRAGWLTAVTGAILAIHRRHVAPPVPPEASADHILPLRVRDADELVLVVPDALASDRVVSTPETQFRNRTRTATRGIRANLSMTGRLTPWRRPSGFLAIWSHKLLRWATPWLARVAGLGAVALAAGGRPAWLVVAVPVVAGLALALLGLATRSRSRVVALPLSILVVCAAFALGWFNVVRGQRITVWRPTADNHVPPAPDIADRSGNVQGPGRSEETPS